MPVTCPFCSMLFSKKTGQILIDAYQHIQHLYAVCFTCFKQIVREFRICDFQRVSLLSQKGNQKLSKLKKTNDDLRAHLGTRMLGLKEAMRREVIEDYFDRDNVMKKSQKSEVSTDPSSGFEIEENSQNPTKASIILPSIKAQESTTIQKLSVIRDRLTSTGMNLIERLKQNQRIEKQVQNLSNYKQRIMEKGGAVKNKLSKFRSEMKNMGSELPSLRQTIKGIEIKGILKSKLFGKW